MLKINDKILNMEKRIKPKDWIKLEPFAVINKLGLHYDISTAEIAEKAGYDRPQAFYDVMSGKTKKISPKMAEKIKKAFPDINEDWLLTGKGSDFNLAQTAASHSSNHTTGIYTVNRKRREVEFLKHVRV